MRLINNKFGDILRSSLCMFVILYNFISVFPVFSMNSELTEFLLLINPTSKIHINHINFQKW